LALHVGARLSGSLTWAKLLRKPSTRQGTAEEELFA
jgi:hypothetical protein